VKYRHTLRVNLYKGSKIAIIGSSSLYVVYGTIFGCMQDNKPSDPFSSFFNNIGKLLITTHRPEIYMRDTMAYDLIE